MANESKETLISGDKKTPIVYFVLPCYNEVEGLNHTADVLRQKMTQLINESLIDSRSRVLFVDDGSHDGTWELIEKIHASDANLFGGVKLAHNRGHQNALYAGLMAAYSAGCDAAISMDADLQDDVDASDEMIKQFSEQH